MNAPKIGALLLCAGLFVGAAGAAAADSQPVPAVQVNHIVLDGNTALAANEVASVTEAYTGRMLTLAQIQQAADGLTDFYQQHGYFLASVYVPDQSFDQGTIHLRALEGDFGQVRVDNRSALRPEVAQRFTSAMVPGAAITDRSYRRPILLLNDLPGVSANGEMSRGASTGATDTVVTLTDADRLTGNLTAVGDGAGNAQASFTAVLRDLTGRGDQLTVGPLNLRAGTEGLGLTYQTPIGGRGFTATVGYSSSVLRYSSLFGLVVENGGRGGRLGLQVPLIRSRPLSETLQLDYNTRRQWQKIGLQTVRESQNGRLTLTLARDVQNGSKSFSSTAALTVGGLQLGPSGAVAQDQAGPQSAGSYTRFNLTGAFTEPLSTSTTLDFDWQGQFVSKNLDPSEQMAFGGTEGVRAYGSSDATGDQGLLGRAEWRRSLTPDRAAFSAELLSYFDAALVQSVRNDWTASGRSDPQLFAGAGWGLKLANGPFSAGLLNAYPVGVAKGGQGGRWWLSGTVTF